MFRIRINNVSIFKLCSWILDVLKDRFYLIDDYDSGHRLWSDVVRIVWVESGGHFVGASVWRRLHVDCRNIREIENNMVFEICITFLLCNRSDVDYYLERDESAKYICKTMPFILKNIVLYYVFKGCSPQVFDVCIQTGTDVLRSLSFATTYASLWADYAGMIFCAALMNTIGFLCVKRMVQKSGYY